MLDNIFHNKSITVSIEDGATFEFKPDSPQWAEAVSLLESYYTEGELLKYKNTHLVIDSTGN